MSFLLAASVLIALTLVGIGIGWFIIFGVNKLSDCIYGKEEEQ